MYMLLPPYLWGSLWHPPFAQCSVFSTFSARFHFRLSWPSTSIDLYSKISLYLQIINYSTHKFHEFTYAKICSFNPGIFLYTKSTYIVDLFILHVAIAIHHQQVIILCLYKLRYLRDFYNWKFWLLTRFRFQKIKNCALPTLHPLAKLQNSRCNLPKLSHSSLKNLTENLSPNPKNVY